VRDFLSRVFSVSEVERVELRPEITFGRICYSTVKNPSQVWRKLSRALGSADSAPPLPGLSAASAPRIDADLVYLDAPGATQVRVSRIGDSLTTWRVRRQSENTLLLSHPVLRNRRDVVFRLEEELGAILGVEDFHASALTAGVSIRFDSGALTAARLATELEKAWPRLLEGLDGPPSRKRFAAAIGLAGLAFTGQYLVPAVKPIAVAGVTLYSFPNVVNAAKQLRRGEIGIYALYTTGLAFMLVSGAPFAATVMATLMQLWPQLGQRKIVRSQRRLFAGTRRRPARARLAQADGVELEVNVDDLRRHDRVVVGRGEIVPVDGVVEDGHAAVLVDALFGGDRIEDRSQGEAIAAGAFVRDGSLTIRVERAGAQTSASYIDSLLPHTASVGLPSSLEAERIANRNAKPALALSALSYLLTRDLRRSQALIRPDYVTGPRLSAQLSALEGIAHGLHDGVLFRNPAALDRVASAEVYVFDDSAGLGRRRVEVATVESVPGVSAERIVAYALTADRTAHSEQSRALWAFASKGKIARRNAESVTRSAGVARYRDPVGSAIEIATPRYLAAAKIEVPQRFPALPPPRAQATGRRAISELVDYPPALRPLWVLRDGEVIGRVSFARTGEVAGRAVVDALKAHNERAQIVYVSRRAEADAHAIARANGIEVVIGELSQANKLDLIRGLGRRTLWIGDGSHPDSRELIAASTISVSVAPLLRARDDAADILLTQKGLAGLPAVIEIGRAHAARLARDYRTIYAANLLGVAGAFLARFNGLQAGLLSNVGTGLVYARHARALDRLATASEQKRARLQGSAFR
jgi:cation-transporting P-type ATPase C